MESESVNIHSSCPFCGKANPPVVTTMDKYLLFQRRRIRAIEITEGDTEKAEYLITGICGDCWTKSFPPEENSLDTSLTLVYNDRSEE